MQSNANSNLIAALLADSRVGTFTGLITRKQGVERGRGAERKVYGDDLVHTVILTGFKYERLVERSLAQLDSITDADVIAAGQRKGYTLTPTDVAAAREELRQSFKDTLAGTNEATTDHVYEPLKVDGEGVRSGRVYKCVVAEGIKCHCRKCSGDARQPVTGTIFVQGLRIWTEVLEPAANGPAPAPKSAPKTVAKDALRHRLPVGKYVSYRLEPGTDFILRAGGTAAIEATKAGFKVTDDLADLINKAA